MWPSGEAEVCKTFYGGSNPSITAVAGKQSLSAGGVSTLPFLGTHLLFLWNIVRDIGFVHVMYLQQLLFPEGL